MRTTSLKSIFKRNQQLVLLLQQVIADASTEICLEDAEGNLLFGQQGNNAGEKYLVVVDHVVSGYVYGGEKAEFIASWLSQWLEQEQAKKQLGAEVLHLYREINLIFNFSEQLASAVGAEAIAQLALREAGRLIAFDKGAVALQKEPDAEPDILAHAGAPDFPNPEQLKTGGFYRPIITAGASQIIRLPEQPGAAPDTEKWLLYATLKVKHRVLGAILLIRSGAHEEFTAADLKLLTTLALQSGAAMESALLHEKATARALEQQREQLVIDLAMRDPFFRRVATIIENRHADPEFNVEELSRAVHLSPSQLQRKILNLTDKTPLQLIRDQRLHKAKALLLDSEMTVSEIAWQSGFSDPSYFTRVFTREVGQTPTAWKEAELASD